VLTLFLSPSVKAYGGVRLGQYPYIERRFSENFRTVRDHYRTRNLAVKNTHFLVTALDSLPIADTGSPHRFADVAASLAPNLLNRFGVGSDRYVGKFQATQRFFGSNVYEYLYLTQSYYDEFTLKPSEWMYLRPIQVLSHPRTDFDYSILAGQITTEESGHAFITIDFGLLAFQYHCWRKEHLRKNGGVFLGSVRQFLVQYPLANLIPSYNNIAWYNTVFRSAIGYTPALSVNRPPLAIPDSYTYVRETAAQFHANLTRTGRALQAEALLQWIPSVDMYASNAAEDTYCYPTRVHSTPAEVARWFCQLDWCETVFGILFQNEAIKNNRALVNEYLKDYRRLVNTKLLQDVAMPLDARDYLNRKLDTILAYITEGA